MKRYQMVMFVLVMVGMMVFTPMVMGEAVDTMPKEGGIIPVFEKAEFFDIAILATYLGAMAGAEVLFLVIRSLAKLEGDAARIAIVVCSIVTVAVGRFFGGDPVTATNIVLTVFNGGLISLALMKVYELTLGKPDAPAGIIRYLP